MSHEDQLARLVAQHARTAQLMGVDFVPAFRRVSGPGGPVPLEESARGEPSLATTSGAGASVGPDVATFPARMEAPAEVKPVAPSAGASAGPGTVRPATRTASRDSAAAPCPPSSSRDREQIRARLAEIRARYDRDAPHQHFVTSFNKIVFGDGDPAARLMFIGEAPGEEEDRTGVPFVGRAGQLLNKMINAMGLRREDVYITNVLKTRPPNNATPTQEEAKLCSPYLFDQIAAISPEAIVTLGLPATRLLLETMESMSRLRGTWHAYTTPDGRAIPVMPTYHPAFLLRSYTPENRAKVWSDLQLVMNKLGLRATPGESGA